MCIYSCLWLHSERCDFLESWIAELTVYSVCVCVSAFFPQVCKCVEGFLQCHYLMTRDKNT